MARATSSCSARAGGIGSHEVHHNGGVGTPEISIEADVSIGEIQISEEGN